MTSTRDGPARSLYAEVAQVADRPELLDAAIWVGFAWADQPRCSGAVVVTGWREADVVAAARVLAQRFWDVRREFAFVAPAAPLEQCLDEAVEVIGSGSRPYVVSDSGDNPGAGGAGDVTITLGALLARPEIADGRVRALLVSIVDPETVAQLRGCTLGAAVSVRVGWRVDARSPGPVRFDGTLEAEAWDPDGGRVVSVRTGGLSVVVTERRMQFNLRASYERLGLHPVAAGIDLVVVKMGYLEPDLHAIAVGHRLALTPGGVDQVIERLDYQRISRPMFPLDDPDDVELKVLSGGG